MRLLILDTETTGLTPGRDLLIEVAAVTYCTDSATTLAGVHFLIPTTEPNRAEHIKHISGTALNQRGIPGMAEVFMKMYEDCDVVIAHNVAFDRKFIEAQWPQLVGKPWVCSMKDITFPAGKGCKKLNHLAVDHGVNVIDAHRAMGDVIVLVRLLSLVPDLVTQIENVLGRQEPAGEVQGPIEPSVLFEVVDTRYDLAMNNKYKAAGFRWDPEARRWRKQFRGSQEPNVEFQIKRVVSPGSTTEA